ILRAYHVAGRPRQDLVVFGRFEAWSDWIRSALVWLGEADPLKSRERLKQADPIRELLGSVLIRWHELIKEACVTAAEAVARAAAAKGAVTDDTTLFDAFAAVAPARVAGQIDNKRLGHWLHSFTNRIELGLRIERVGDKKGVALWRVVSIERK